MDAELLVESIGEEYDEELPPGLKIPTGYKNYMTPAGYASLRAEFDRLVKQERPRVVDVVAWAASNGDRSENGDYIYGKRRLREIDRRIRFLTKRIESADVIDPLQQSNNDQVFFGATVTVSYDREPEQVFSIVGVDEADVGRGRISWVSPLARALIKAKEGDIVKLKTPAGVREIEILEVVYQSISD